MSEALLRITGRERLGEPGVPDHERRARRRRRRIELARLAPEPVRILVIRVIPVDQKMLNA